ncbi:MAG TPA: class I SAM-dependent methyltransferase [Ktedonobacteraceae bacterium]|nr:class I SAM-dependent methyltransferase [Ktedonobacteraceae bacterium]
MDDTTNLNPPAVINELAKTATILNFTLSSDQLTGSLLRTLAASKPGGELLELGTGVGMGTAWLLAGMDTTAHLTTVDRNRETTATAHRLMDADSRVTFQLMDGIAFIHSCHEQKRMFDLIFADSVPGKFAALEDTLALLKQGGLYVIDDLNPQPGWSADHPPKVEHLLSVLEGRADLSITKFNWSVGLLVAAKR